MRPAPPPPTEFNFAQHLIAVAGAAAEVVGAVAALNRVGRPAPADRVLAAALCTQYWHDRIRSGLQKNRVTRELVQSKKRLSLRDMTSMYVDYQMSQFFKAKEDSQRRLMLAARRQSWRARR